MAQLTSGCVYLYFLQRRNAFSKAELSQLQLQTALAAGRQVYTTPAPSVPAARMARLTSEF